MTGREIDHDLMKLARGDRAALERLYGALRQPVFLLAFTLSRDEEIAKDVMQDTFVALCGSAGRFCPRGAGRAYVLGVARRLTLQRIAERARTPLFADGEIPEQAEADAFTARIEGQAYAAQLLAALDERERDIVILHVLVGLKHREIAAALHLPLGTVCRAYREAVAKLRDAVDDERRASSCKSEQREKT